ncbi:gliding motility-associated C-terminal domain-containing protein [Flavobacterium sp.]|uniref:T9SS type B sorting domain-containing protein n=1 Tax=Flavobacterium sp. TaxID=239 RepID=UPI002A7FDADA|nr:gliding motility-associated C-terminal domain-containing protein [Flavobacterium sp.]
MKKLLLFFMSLFTFFSYGQLTEGFEGATFPPTGWTTFDNGIGLTRSWGITTATGLGWVYAGGKAAIVNKEDVPSGIAEDWMVTPLVTIPANGQLRFFARSIANGEQGSIYKVKISTASQNNPADFTTTIATYTELQIINAPFEQKIIPLTAYVGQNIYIAFVMENDNGDAWIIDNVNVDQQCFAPTALTATPLATSATLNWTYTGPATQFAIEYGPTGFVQGTGTIVSPVTRPYNLTGLSPLTNYTYYVRALCGTDNSSPWSTAMNFTTTASPPVCGGNFVDSGGVSGNYSNNENITTTICPVTPGDLVTVTFTSFNTESGWDFLRVYDGNSIAAPLLGTFSGTAIPGPFTATSANGCLTFRFTSDGSVTRAGWTSNVTCAPPPTCPRPSAVTVTAIGQTQASINWTENGPATQWQVLVLPASSPIPTAATPGWRTTSTRPFIYTGLNSGTQYKAYVRSICSLGVDESTVSVGTAFSTLIANDECINATVTPVNDDTSCLQTASGTLIGATASTPASTCTGTADDDVWFQFTATSTTHYISLVNVTGSTTDLYHVLYSGTCGSLTRLYCSDPNDSTASGLIIGQTYFVRVYSWTSTPGQTTVFNLCVGTPVSCSDADAFCGDTGLVYTNSTGAPSYGAIGCLGTTPNPSWYFMQIDQAGSLNFQIAQTSTATGAGIDVDYIIWGPFSPAQFPTACNNLYGYPVGNTSFPTNVASCSYSTAAIENFSIANANLNDIYLVLITNFSNQPGTVTFTQTGGTGSTNCSIVCSNNIGADQVFCNTATYQINSSNTTADNYAWYFNNVLISGVNTSSITVSQSGTYKCIITCGINQVQDEIVLTFNPSVTPTFNPIAAFCRNTTSPVLPNTSTNGISGTWFPAVVDNMNSGVYTFTPNVGVCASPVNVSITVTPETVPSFVSPAPICSGSTAPVLSNTSNNGIAGTWFPATVSNTASGTYTFTPNVGQCASVTTLDVEVIATCTFGTIASAVLIDNCNTSASGEFFNTTSGSQTIGAVSNVFPNSNLGTYVQASGNLMFNGAELRTFKTVTTNVCSARLNYRVYPAATAPGVFTIVNLPLLESCTAGTYPTGGASCNDRDQRWQFVSAALDLTANTPGNYIIEVYYDVTGDNDSTSQCDDTIVLDNGGAYYSASFSIQSSPTFTFTNPTTCNGTNGTITASGFVMGNVYSVTYTDDAVTVGPTNFTANVNGEILITGLNAGVYSNFNFSINGCSILDGIEITLVNPIYNPTFNQIGPFCVGDAITLPLTSIEGYSGSWSPPVDNTQTVTYTFTPDSGQCATVFTTYTVTVNPIPSVTNVTSNTPICVGEDAIFTIQGTPNASLDYTINAVGGTTILDASGSATITVTNPPVGNVTLNLSNIDNGACNTALTNTSTVVVRALPTVTSLTAVNSSICLGSDAEFTIQGTPNATVTYQVGSGGNETVLLNTSGQSGIITVTNPTADVVILLTNINDGTCNNTLSNTITITVNSVPTPTIDITSLPTCADQTATFEVLSPLNMQLNTAGNLFISEVTDADPGALTYVEIYNGTGATVDLSNYKLKVFTVFGSSTPTCDLTLSGNLLNNDVVVIKLSSSAGAGGVVADLTYATCGGVNNNDQISLATSADVIIDTWGINGTVFTPGVGYTYRRLTTATPLPSTTWNAADWTVLDPEDYTDVGFYTLYVTNYEYILSNGTTTTTQTSVDFTGVIPGTYTLVVHDLITDCYSQPYTFTIDPFIYANPVTTFTYVSPVCISDSINPMPDTSIAGFSTGGTFTGNNSNIVIDSSTGEVDLYLSFPGTYTITYTFAQDATNCINSGSSQFVLVINALETPTFNNVEVCVNSDFQLPVQSIEGYDGTWSPSIADVSVTGTTTYYFTPNNSSCSQVGELVVVVETCVIPKGVSPNGDGLNDNWDLSTFDVKKVQIFNRYGKEVYSKSNYTNEWVGKSNNGNELPDGTYYYVIEFNDMAPRTGWVYINREQ